MSEEEGTETLFGRQTLSTEEIKEKAREKTSGSQSTKTPVRPKVGVTEPKPSQTPSPDAPGWVHKQSEDIIAAGEEEGIKGIMEVAPVTHTPDPEFAHHFDQPETGEEPSTEEPSPVPEPRQPSQSAADKKTEAASPTPTKTPQKSK